MAGLSESRAEWLFQSFDRTTKKLTGRKLNRTNVLDMVKRRAKRAGLPWQSVTNHNFRATGITNYMKNGGRIEAAQKQAGHADSPTTKLYDRSGAKMTKAEVERMRLERSGP